MLYPEAECLVAVVDGILVFTEHGHEEIFGYRNLVASAANGAEDVVLVVDGAALDDVERVAEILGIPVAQLHLHVQPHATVEAVDLRLHVGHVERLRVGLGVVVIAAVGRGHDVAVVVAGVPVGVFGEMIGRIEVGVVGIFRELTAIIIGLS